MNVLGRRKIEQKAEPNLKPPKPKKLIGLMVQDEAQEYLKDLLSWIFQVKKGLKPRDYRKWPLYKDGELLEAATNLEE